jgi:predicted phage baseplate assembly protein
MPLPAIRLDNRTAQDIVDEAKRLIPRLCPEWTDHNVSDPGIAIVELFAWMTEMLLYRTNQVPEKNYIRFLEMIGIRLSPPRAAQVPVTFYLSGPQMDEKTIELGAEVATMRTETAPAIVFTTEADLTIRPPVLADAYTQRASHGDAGWAKHDLGRLELQDESIVLFPNPPRKDDGFYFALRNDHSHHVLAVIVGCRAAEGAGVDPSKPPVEWEVWQSPLARWVACTVEHDGTGGFNNDGEIVLRLPAMAEEEFANRRAYWLRCRLVDNGRPQYEVSPQIERFCRLESRGGTVGARHATTVENERLGQSTGDAGQVFMLSNSPILWRDPATDHLIVEPIGEVPQEWHEVEDFADAAPGDRCYTLDGDGTLTLGPALLQPDGSRYHFGAVPPKGSGLRFSRYQYGGGVAGNVPAGAVSVLKSSIPYVAHVRNYERALGGRDAQDLEDAKLGAARQLRSQARAVTAEDFEFHASRAPGIARARCLAPGAQPGDGFAIGPGQVFVLVLPQLESVERPRPQQLVLSDDLRRIVLDDLCARSVIGIGVEVRLPEITWISVTADLIVAEHSHADILARVRRRAERDLYAYLNPYTGGPAQGGWPFGRDLHLSEIYGLLQRIPSVEYVEGVRMEIHEPGGSSPRPAPPRIVVPRYGLVCSAEHTIHVATPRRDRIG